MDLIKQFTSSQWGAALDTWRWIGLDGTIPRFASLFGHVCLDSAEGIWWLDPIEGAVTREWEDKADLDRVLATEDGQDEFLLAGLALGAERRGILLGPDQIYVFAPPPILGGGLAFENLQVMDFEVGMSVQGQLHDQLRHMPPGSQLSGSEFRED